MFLSKHTENYTINTMISVKNAEEIIKQKSKNLKITVLPILECLHGISAEDVYAPIDVPVFDNSAMDGYAFRFEDVVNQLDIKISEEIQAGTETLLPLAKGTCARIYTGAPIPQNADTVVAQEDVSIENKILRIKKNIEQSSNIRKRGSQTPKGSLILKKNTLLTAEYIGFLATFGINELQVYASPKIGIIVTGKELVKIGEPLKSNQIYESNSVFLKAAFQEIGIVPQFCIWADDNRDLLKKIVLENYQSVDILIFTGGISVGDYDFVKPVLEELGTEEMFYKVKQKPGKPLFFGLLNETEIFALPGNPSAVVVCFHGYIKPYIKSKMGIEAYDKKEFGILINEYSKKPGLTHYVKAYVENHKVEILSSQLSYQMDAYSKANALAILSEDQEQFQIGEKVEIIKFKN